jgi:hypothetical protein
LCASCSRLAIVSSSILAPFDSQPHSRCLVEDPRLHVIFTVHAYWIAPVPDVSARSAAQLALPFRGARSQYEKHGSCDDDGKSSTRFHVAAPLQRRIDTGIR